MTNQMFFTFTKQKRRTLFYLSVLVFFVLAPLLILYSLGYNIDFRTGQFLRTGGIFLKASPGGFRVFLNGNPIKESGVLFSGALMVNLRPDLYMVRIEKEGHRPWQKVVHVSAETVSEFRHILLFPEEFSKEEIFNLSRRGMTFENSLEAVEGTPWVFFKTGETPARTTFFHLENGALNSAASFRMFQWDGATKRLTVRRQNLNEWAIIRLSAKNIQEELLRFSGIAGDPVFVAGVPDQPDEFFVLDQKKILFRTRRLRSGQTPILSDIHSFGVHDGHILYLTKTGFFAVSGLNGEDAVRYGRKGFFMTEVPAQFGVSPLGGDMFVIDSAGGFFVKRREETEITPISGNVIGAAFSRDGEKILFWSEHDIQILFLANEKNQPFRTAGTREKIISVPDKSIQWASWFGKGDAHILFAAGSFAAVADLDSRGEGGSATILFESSEGLMRYKKDAGIILRGENGSLFVTKVE